MRVVVTGGSSGVGAALTRMLVDKGHSVFIIGRDAGAMEKLSNECNRDKDKPLLGFAKGDVAESSTVSQHFGKALDFFGGRCDALVANAGCSAKRSTVEGVAEADYDRIMNTNVKGVFLWLQQVLPHLREHDHGQVVVTSSVCGVRYVPNAAIYTASKWAVEGMIGSLRRELAGTHVKACTVCPGPIDTPWWTEAHRGGGRAPSEIPPKEKMLSAEAVAQSILNVLEQPASSNIERVVLDPTTI